MKLKITTFILFAILLSNCASLTVTTQGAVPVTTVTGEVERDTTIHLIIGTSKTWQENLCNGAPPAEVSISTNFFGSLANVITLGIWKPIKVKYKCNEPCNQ